MRIFRCRFLSLSIPLPLSHSLSLKVMKTNSFKIHEPWNFIWIIYVHYPSASRHFAKLFMDETHSARLPGNSSTIYTRYTPQAEAYRVCLSWWSVSFAAS